ncbi:MAG: hypothetical protein IPH53_04040 [Flavobacteriales bacterium]|nr:hypothetical protein [Flavobacteriales bacterium]
MEGLAAPAPLVARYTGAVSSQARMRAASNIVDTLLLIGTAQAQLAWADSLRMLASLEQDSTMLAKAHFARGDALVRDGRIGRAFDDLRAVLVLCDEHHDPVLVARTHARIGDGLMRMGGSTGAIQRYNEVLRIARKTRLPARVLVHVLSSEAYIHADLEHLDSAVMYYQQAPAAARAGALSSMEARAYIGLGDVAGMRDDHATAEVLYRKAIATLSTGTEERTMLDARLALGGVLLITGPLDPARIELRSAMRLADSLRVRGSAAKARIFLADAMGDDHRAALQLLDEADTISRTDALGAMRKEVLLSRSERYARMGRLREAYDLSVRALALTDSLNMAFWEEGARRQLQRSQVGLKDREIDALEQRGEEQGVLAELRMGQLRQQRILITVWVIVALAVLALALTAWRAYRKQRRTAEALERAHAEVLVQKQRAEESERAKDRFLANVSHEIRTPLNAIMGFSNILLESGPDEQSARFLHSIRDAGDNLMAVINDVLDIGRMEAWRLTLIQEAFDLHRCAKQCGELLRHRVDQQRNNLIIGIAADTPQWVTGDGARLTQILLNLLGNALKFTADGEVQLNIFGNPGKCAFA